MPSLCTATAEHALQAVYTGIWDIFLGTSVQRIACALALCRVRYGDKVFGCHLLHRGSFNLVDIGLEQWLAVSGNENLYAC